MLREFSTAHERSTSTESAPAPDIKPGTPSPVGFSARRQLVRRSVTTLTRAVQVAPNHVHHKLRAVEQRD